jgi:hypothetical protein
MARWGRVEIFFSADWSESLPAMLSACRNSVELNEASITRMAKRIHWCQGPQTALGWAFCAGRTDGVMARTSDGSDPRTQTASVARSGSDPGMRSGWARFTFLPEASAERNRQITCRRRYCPARNRRYGGSSSRLINLCTGHPLLVGHSR